MNALEIKELTKKYGKAVAVDNIDLTIKKGEFFGLLGQNGAGKSTTINCITGISQFAQGSIAVMGNDVQEEYQKARISIGLSPQEFNADIFAPLEKILNFVGGYFGLDSKTRAERINEVLDRFELQEHRKKPFGKLSGGLKRRAILARALIHRPELLILDEPTAGVDVEQRHALWKYLEDLHNSGTTIILTSHYLEEVEHLCSRVAIMHNGEIIADLSKKEFTKNGDKLEDTYLKLTAKKV
ncbi:ABC transporter ATP-binding protein [Candidatus Uhrbacteria bacterium]|jgi:ABC-2 type transport system ATP-binding protein|nr:ABC transporter ATP-binding protein [Candidatus Uhrbacteria bacterium]MBT7716750.1 ABC transporter ATP-binding protein [Candidatus Uhrbacteria bacterium]